MQYVLYFSFVFFRSKNKEPHTISVYGPSFWEKREDL